MLPAVIINGAKRADPLEGGREGGKQTAQGHETHHLVDSPFLLSHVRAASVNEMSGFACIPLYMCSIYIFTCIAIVHYYPMMFL